MVGGFISILFFFNKWLLLAFGVFSSLNKKIILLLHDFTYY